MTGERESFASRRALLTGAPALAVVAAAPIVNATAKSAVASADPYVSLAADFRQAVSLVDDDDISTAEWDEAVDRWSQVQERMTAACATSPAGAIAGLQLILPQFTRREHRQNRFIAAVITSAIGVLEQGTAHV